MAENNHTLLMQLGPKQGEIVAVLGDEFVIGRDPTCDWSIEDIEVSRRHARLVFEKGTYSIEDLGSTNGTFVNGQRIRSVLPLLPGATIRLGENVLLFFDSASPENEDTSTKTVSVEKESSAKESEPSAEESPLSPSPEEPLAKAEAVDEPSPSIQEMNKPPRRRRSRQTSVPIFGNQIGLGVLAIGLVGALALIAFLWYVDANLLWCDVFGNLISACR